jgi:hypothetical protein
MSIQLNQCVVCGRYFRESELNHRQCCRSCNVPPPKPPVAKLNPEPAVIVAPVVKHRRPINPGWVIVALLIIAFLFYGGKSALESYHDSEVDRIMATTPLVRKEEASFAVTNGREKQLQEESDIRVIVARTGYRYEDAREMYYRERAYHNSQTNSGYETK